MRSTVLTLTLLSLTACNDMSLNGAIGITQGGSQDMKQARQMIEDGLIPYTGSFTAEGLFSEHDLPIEPGDCELAVCPQPAMAQYLPVDGEPGRHLMQMGFDSAISVDDFERKALDLAIAVDISGSMTDQFALVQASVLAAVDQLGPNDEVALITYGSRANVEMSSRSMDADGREELRRAVERLDSGGSTDMEAGMELAFELVDDNDHEGDHDQRIIVFTDANPTSGLLEDSAFTQMVTTYSGQGIGCTLIGSGVDLGAELAVAISEVRGGNYFFVRDEDDAGELFGEEFEFMVTPLAYDFSAHVQLADGVELVASYGAPTTEDLDEFSFGASTLFASSRDGAIAATFARPTRDALLPGDVLGTVVTVYTPVDGGAAIEDSAEIVVGGDALDAERGRSDELGPFKLAGLLNEFKALEAAAQACSGELDAGIAAERVHEAREHLIDVTKVGAAGDMKPEVDLMTDLLALVEAPELSCAR